MINLIISSLNNTHRQLNRIKMVQFLGIVKNAKILPTGVRINNKIIAIKTTLTIGTHRRFSMLRENSVLLTFIDNA